MDSKLENEMINTKQERMLIDVANRKLTGSVIKLGFRREASNAAGTAFKLFHIYVYIHINKYVKLKD
jgi:hypothetical protein